MRVDRITPAHVRRNQRERLARLDALPVRGWGCNTLGNHDSSRVFTRFAGDSGHAAELTRLNAALVLTLRGTPFLYNGEEIGMTDLIITDPGRLRDTMATWYYRAEVEEIHADPAEAAQRAGKMSRDKNRTPVQWTNAANAGFCPADVEPWLPVNPNYAQGVNVADQADDPASMLSYYRRLIQARRVTPALQAGEYRPLHEQARSYLAFLRQTPEQTVLVVLNYTDRRRGLSFDLPGMTAGRVIFSSHDHAGEIGLDRLRLAPFEMLIVELGS
jgi:alpha-glucosidase